jgi:hypothetical protein
MKCRELYRNSLGLDAANDRPFRRRVRASVFSRTTARSNRWPPWRLSRAQFLHRLLNSNEIGSIDVGLEVP